MLAAWIITCIGFMLLPGPDMALVTRFTLSQGIRGGARAALGINTAFLIYAALLALGLGGLITGSQLLMEAIRYLGGAYLIYLGISALQHAGDQGGPSVPSGNEPFKAGMLSNLLNPKQAVFLLILMPSFANPGHTSLPLLMAILLGVSILFWAIWIPLVSKLGERLAEHHAWPERVIGVSLMLIGITLIAGVL